MNVVRAGDCRRTETPNAVMTTLASPTQGGSTHAVWRVEMTPGATGPVHVFDTDQVWTILDGTVRIDVAGETVGLAAGDTVVLPADARRQVFADGAVTAIVCAPASTRVYGQAVPACAVADGDRILPDWVA